MMLLPRDTQSIVSVLKNIRGVLNTPIKYEVSFSGYKKPETESTQAKYFLEKFTTLSSFPNICSLDITKADSLLDPVLLYT